MFAEALQGLEDPQLQVPKKQVQFWAALGAKEGRDGAARSVLARPDLVSSLKTGMFWPGTSRRMWAGWEESSTEQPK